ncbi:Glycosyltransferase involved in cell wall bisynthesis [Arachidicoccus rhizosphaerae]|uniref:Glycosyltransferase involved in cell wall bisynthesis n=1 Tax=Arachidicoccus rhizosphaerae TaxID=551991 RepID=A0A1H3W1R4_9BACT|nr:glycosyltransferase [Arachidicoccus rhizosphaerae]SDZ80354.1 Glycosyltransferase involved in cell wall bisynthesis [Arachidicoccus rhizosphaerae]
MINVLWLPSWYPSIESLQNGDFIERHAHATSFYANIRLLFIQSSKKVNRRTVYDLCLNKDCDERVVLFPSFSLIGSINFIKYIYYYNEYISTYFSNETRIDLVHVHVSYKAGLVALWLKIRFGIPYVLTEHWTLFSKGRINEYKNKGFIFKFILKKIFKNASVVMPVSRDLECSLINDFGIKRTKVIPNVVDNKLFYFDKKSSINFSFIHVSSGKPVKNVGKIVSSFLRLNKVADLNLFLLIVGIYKVDEYDSDFLKERNVLLYGMLDHSDVAINMRKANSFILFSDYENLPCVVAESLCCGLPVISSSINGVPEMVNDSNGILVPPGDEEALYLAMEDMILNYSRYDREKISQQAQAKYNPEVVGRQIVEVYEKVLSKKSGS